MPRVSKFELPPIPASAEPIGHRLARLRKEAGLSQVQLAQKIGIDQKLVSDYETGKIRLYDEMVARFAFALGVSTDIILGVREVQSLEPAPNLRIWKRLKKIEQLPLAKQKQVLASIDDTLKANGLYPVDSKE